MEWVIIGSIVVLGTSSTALFYYLLARVYDLHRRLGGVEQRFHDGGVDLTDRMATDVIITEKWAEWDQIKDEDLSDQQPAMPRKALDVWE